MFLYPRIYTDKTTFSLRPVINATGIPLHTNLGRAPLARSGRYHGGSSARLLQSGSCRWPPASRRHYNHVADLLIALTGAEDALVVSNNAAAVLLVLDTLAQGRRGNSSRGPTEWRSARASAFPIS